MIVSPSAGVALSNLGWVDRGSLWLLRTGEIDPEHIELDDAEHLRLAAGTASDDVFTVAHHYSSAERCLVTAHLASRPSEVIASVSTDGWKVATVGALSAFAGQKRLHVTYLRGGKFGNGGYFVIDIAESTVRVRRLDWFDDRTYDHGYQSVMSALLIPGQGYLFGVQRSSELVLCDPTDLAVIRRVRLTGSLGNPTPFLRDTGRELWAVDYDTVVRLDTSSWRVTGEWRGQQDVQGTGMFLGEPWLSPDEDKILVARPGSGDVVALDPATMKVRDQWYTGRQPLACALLDRQLIARDWKTGDLLRSSE
jgi:YVTN family beta-propeller protein